MSILFRCHLSLFIILAASSLLAPTLTWSQDPCAVEHPFMPPKNDLVGQCPNCGMLKSMWARTWKSFANSEGKFEVCSLHCLADMAVKSGEEPKNVMVALYMQPERMIPQERAVFVVGSKAKGTMTMTGKTAFASKEEAVRFAQGCGGQLMTFSEAFQLAKEDLPKENLMIARNRVQSGKIVEPQDNKDACTVCGMYPARYPQNKCQLTGPDKQVRQFCSTQCLFTFLADFKSPAKKDSGPQTAWVTDYPTGSWISARTAYYVVGSKVQGPMGQEAFAFNKKADAGKFAKEERGKVLTFREMDSGKIKLKE